MPGQILFRPEQSASLGSVAPAGLLGGSDSSIDNELQIIASKAFAEKVIKKLKLTEKPGELLDNLFVGNPDRTDIINITYTDPDVEKAAKITNAFIELYIEQSRQNNHREMQVTIDFLEGEIPKTEASLKSLENNLRNFRNQYKILDSVSESTSTAARLNQIRQQIETLNTQLVSNQARLATIRNTFGFTPQDSAISASLAVDTQAADRTLQQLQDVRQQLAVARITLTENHPQIQQLKEQEALLSAAVQRRLEQGYINQAGESVRPSSAEQIKQPGVLQRQLLTEYTTLESQTQSIETQLVNLQTLQRQYSERVNLLPQLQLQERRLQREIAIKEQSYQQMQQTYQQLLTNINQQLANARILALADTQVQSTNPGKNRILVLSFLGGLIVSGGLIYFLDKLDPTLRTVEDVQALLPYTILGSVPTRSKRLSKNSQERWLVEEESNDPITESFRVLRTSIKMNLNAGEKILLVTSSLQGEGKSTISSNLALIFAEGGSKVLLIEGDLRKPKQHEVWQIEQTPGLTEVLNKKVAFRDAVVKVRPNLDVLPSGEHAKNALRVIESDNMSQTIQEYGKDYDLVIIDSPPLTVSADSTIWAKSVADKVLLVSRLGVANTKSVNAINRILTRSNVNVLGLILNGVTKDDGYYSYGYGYYGSQNGSSPNGRAEGTDKILHTLSRMMGNRTKN